MSNLENIKRKVAVYKLQIEEKEDIIDQLKAELSKEREERDKVWPIFSFSAYPYF